MLKDPGVLICDAECGSITVGTVARYVACRHQCIGPDFTGLLEEILLFAGEGDDGGIFIS
jgi:hypothetical protein